jgi:DNA-directed RNA polymerase specialized sigma24 family protein
LAIPARVGPLIPLRPAAIERAQSRPFFIATRQGMTDSVTDAALDYTAFFRDEFAGVLRTIELMLRDHGRAEEIAQDAFVQLYLNWPKVSRYDRPEAWVRRVAIRLVMRSLRRERLWRLVRGELMPSAPAPLSRYDLAGAIRQLSGGQRAAIVLHYYEDRPVAEVATILGCSESTARVQLHRGRRRLAQLLGEDDDGA